MFIIEGGYQSGDNVLYMCVVINCVCCTGMESETDGCPLVWLCASDHKWSLCPASGELTKLGWYSLSDSWEPGLCLSVCLSVSQSVCMCISAYIMCCICGLDLCTNFLIIIVQALKLQLLILVVLSLIRHKDHICPNFIFTQEAYCTSTHYTVAK